MDIALFGDSHGDYSAVVEAVSAGVAPYEGRLPNGIKVIGMGKGDWRIVNLGDL